MQRVPASLLTVTVVLTLCIGALAAGRLVLWPERAAMITVDEETAAVLLQLFPDATDFRIKVQPDTVNNTTVSAYYAYSRDVQLGIAIVADGEGYNGSINVLVALDAGGAVDGARVIAHDETPGIGDAIEEQAFLTLFRGKTGADKIEIGDDIQSISGATVSARGVAEAVRTALALRAVIMGKQ